jgi:phage gp16-like protein
MTHATAAAKISQLKRLIHVGKRELQLDDETYRQLLSITTRGKTSTTEMTLGELERVITAMQQRGFRIKGARSASRPLADDAQSRKIRALWLELHARGYVQNASEAALAAFAKRMTRVEALQWLSAAQASNVIEALKAMTVRDSAKIERLVLVAIRAGKLSGSAFNIPDYINIVTGHAGDLTKPIAVQMIAHLEQLLEGKDHAKP